MPHRRGCDSLRWSNYREALNPWSRDYPAGRQKTSAQVSGCGSSCKDNPEGNNRGRSCDQRILQGLRENGPAIPEDGSVRPSTRLASRFLSRGERSLLLSLGLGSNSNLYHHKLLVLPQVKYCEKRFDQLSIEQRCLS